MEEEMTRAGRTDSLADTATAALPWTAVGEGDAETSGRSSPVHRSRFWALSELATEDSVDEMVCTKLNQQLEAETRLESQAPDGSVPSEVMNCEVPQSPLAARDTRRGVIESASDCGWR